MKIRFLGVILFLALLTISGRLASHAQGNLTPTPLNLNATPNATGKAILFIRVVGRVTNGTAGAKLPDTLKLTLTVIGIDETDLMSTGLKQILVRDTDMAADGSYAFPDVPGQLGYTYTITARYAGGLQTSGVVTLKNARGDLAVPLTIYEASADPSIVRVTRLMATLDFASAPGFVQLSWTYEFTVSGDRLFLTPSRTSQGDPISIVLPLPPGAQNASAGSDNVSKHLVIDATSLQDTLPVLPGEKHALSFSYRLPYQGNLTLTQKMPYGAPEVQFLIPALDDQIKLTGEGFGAGEPVTSQAGNSNIDSFILYRRAGAISPDETLTFVISGTPPVSASTSQLAPTPNLLPYVLLGGGLLLVLIGGIVLLGRRNQRASPSRRPR